MKKFIVSIMLLSLGLQLSAQQLPVSNQQTREDLLQKSKKQKLTANIMMGGGALVGVTGFMIFFLNVMPDGSKQGVAAGGGAAVIGFLSMAGSIPFYIAAGKNKRKAMELSGGLNMERGLYHSYYPAMSVKLRCR